MEENVALDSSKQKKFIKSVKGLQKNIKKKKTQISEKPATPKIKDGKIKKKKRERGLVYLGHIPHGFYEHQMTQYFSQFGGVSNCRVIRSKRTGRSKGYAFVEFHDPAVAQIVAETMNNYLMGKRLIKAQYIEPEKQRRAKRFSWNPQNNPALNTKLKQKKEYNAEKTDAEELKSARRLMKSLNKTKNKLKELGVNYDFFMPVDIPEDLIVIKTEKDKESIKQEDEKPKKKTKETVEVKKEEKPKNKKDNKVTEEKQETVDKSKKGKKKIELEQSTQNKKEQKQKEVKLQKAGVKNVENYIKVNEESENDSDSSMDFDSDEFENILEYDSDGSIGSDYDDDESDDEISEESIVDIPPKKQKTTVNTPPKKQKSTANTPQKNQKIIANTKPVNGNQQKVKQQNKTQDVKKKVPLQATQAQGKKVKFEKQNKKKPVNKQFKKKK